jgi:hypothetical protein
MDPGQLRDLHRAARRRGRAQRPGHGAVAPDTFGLSEIDEDAYPPVHHAAHRHRDARRAPARREHTAAFAVVVLVIAIWTTAAYSFVRFIGGGLAPYAAGRMVAAGVPAENLWAELAKD